MTASNAPIADRIGRIISRHRYTGPSNILCGLGAMFLAVATLLACLIVRVTRGDIGFSGDISLLYNTLAVSAGVGIVLVAFGIARRQPHWLLGENGVAYRKGKDITVWCFEDIAETSRFYKGDFFMVSLAWRGYDGAWTSVNAHLKNFHDFHDALTTGTTAARAPKLFEKLQHGVTVDFKEWPIGASSVLMTNFGATMNILGPKATVAVQLTQEELVVGASRIKLVEIGELSLPDSWKTPALYLYRHDGSTALALHFQRIIDLPLLLALIEMRMAQHATLAA